MNKRNNFRFIILISFVYIVINFVFNFHIWQDILNPSPNNVLAIQGESPIYEYVAERIRLNILTGKNPFDETKEIMFPFEWNFSLDDIAPINGFYFLFLRPFFSIHQSLMIIVLFGIFLANMSMYVLLRKLKVNMFTSFLFGLIYGFTPFISYRVGGHSTYTAIYLFPLLGIVFNLLLDKRNNIKKKLIYSITLGLLFTIALLTNLYYFVMVGILALILLLIFILKDTSYTIKVFRQNLKYFIISAICFVIFLLPWLIKAFEYLSTNSYSSPLNTIDYIPFSADVLNIFLPSRFNPFYNRFLIAISSHLTFITSVFEDFIYPGIIIIVGYIFVVFNYKKLSRSIHNYFWTSIIFLLLTFGPYLKIAGKVTSIPMPFLLFHSIPFVQLARAPGRFIVVFIFLACIVSAYMMDFLIKKHKAKKYALIVFIFILIFFVDQTYFVNKGVGQVLPIKIYTYLKEHHSGPVLNIPFTIRDGLRNIGNPHGIWEPYSQLIHTQPIYSVYAGRLSNDIFNFYKDIYMFDLIDNLINKKKLYPLTSVDKNRLARSFDFFDVKNILLKNDEVYSKIVSDLIKEFNFQPILNDAKYTLYIRKEEVLKEEFLKADFVSTQDNFVLYDGWYNPENGYRWTHGKITKSLFKINQKRPMELKLTAEAIVEPQKIRVFVGKKYIETLIVESGKAKEYKLDLGGNLNKGLNMIIFKFSKSYNLGKLTNNKKDMREVSLNVKNLSLQDSE